MTDKTITMKPGYTDVAGLRDSELWRAVAANLRVEFAEIREASDRTMIDVMIKMFTIAAADSDGHGLTPELAESLDQLATTLINTFRAEWTVTA